MIRALVERLPLMVTPRWVSVPAQSIGIEDVLRYLRAALDLPGDASRVYEIGGPDRVSYGDLMTEYARQRGLRRVHVAVPVLTPRLSSLWLGPVTPLYARVGRKLIESICHPTLVQDPAPARTDFAIEPIGVREAITRARGRSDARGLADRRAVRVGRDFEFEPGAARAADALDRRERSSSRGRGVHRARVHEPIAEAHAAPFARLAGRPERVRPARCGELAILVRERHGPLR
jgi:hypothetical protein